MQLFKKKYYQSTDPQQLSDHKLVENYKSSSDNVFLEEIFNRYTHLVYGVCLKYLKNRDNAQDAVMQIFEQLIIKLTSHDINNFKSWLYSVSKNHCLMILRKEQRSAEQNIQLKNYHHELMENVQEEHLPIDEDFEKHLNNLEAAIQSLKDEQKKCIDMFYLQKKSYQEIVSITGYSEKQVKSYIQNGKRNLKNILLKV